MTGLKIANGAAKEIKKTFPLFGDKIKIIIYDIDEFFAEEIFQEIYDEALRLQNIFNFFYPESELSALNKKRALLASEELLHVIKNALKYCKETSGSYDISKGMEIRDRKQGNALKPSSCTYKDIKIDGNMITLQHPDVLIDLGSIAKGYIVDKLMEFMQNQGIESGFIDARGDMRIFGKHLEIVEIQHPRKRKNASPPIVLENKAIATSGDYNQYDEKFDKCHIIGKKDLVSVTVIADTLMEADVLATCIFLLGEHKAKSFLTQYKNITAFVFNENLKSYPINRFRKYLLKGKQNE